MVNTIKVAMTAAILGLIAYVVWIGMSGMMDPLDPGRANPPKPVTRAMQPSLRPVQQRRNDWADFDPTAVSTSTATFTGRLEVAKNLTPEELKIESELEKTVTLKFAALPLSDVVQSLSEQFQIPVQVDLAALEQNQLTGHEAISFAASEKTLRDSLNLMLKDVGGVELAAILDKNRLQITTREAADAKLVTYIYDIRPLNITDASLSLETIKGGTSGHWGDEWTSVPGHPDQRTKTTHGQMTLADGHLTILQSQPVHAELENLLNQLAVQTQTSLNYRGRSHFGRRFHHDEEDVGGSNREFSGKGIF